MRHGIKRNWPGLINPLAGIGSGEMISIGFTPNRLARVSSVSPDCEVYVKGGPLASNSVDVGNGVGSTVAVAVSISGVGVNRNGSGVSDAVGSLVTVLLGKIKNAVGSGVLSANAASAVAVKMLGVMQLLLQTIETAAPNNPKKSRRALLCEIMI